MKTILKLHNLVPRIPELRFQEPIDWEIKEGEQWRLSDLMVRGKHYWPI